MLLTFSFYDLLHDRKERVEKKEKYDGSDIGTN